MRTINKLLSLMLAVVMLLGMLPTASAELYYPTDGNTNGACNHIFQWVWPNGEPDCMHSARHENRCIRCGYVGCSVTKFGPCKPSGWQWMDGPPMNCQELKGRYIYCLVCGEHLDLDEVQGKHSFEPRYTQMPTCTESGYREYICTYCGSEDGNPEYVDPLGHSFGEWTTEVAGTCVTPGRRSHTCTRCGYKETQNAAYGDHNWGAWTVISQGTCVQPTVEQRTCTLCGTPQTRQTPGGAHNWGSWTVVQSGNCQTPAVEQRVCSRCSATETRNGAMGGHSYGSWIRQSIPTCTELGQEARRCQICNHRQFRDLPALGHDLGAWYVVTEPQVGVPGLEQRDCSRCDLSETREIPALEGPALVSGLQLEVVSEIPAYISQLDYTNVQLRATNTGTSALHLTFFTAHDGVVKTAENTFLQNPDVFTLPGDTADPSRLLPGESYDFTLSILPSDNDRLGTIMTRFVSVTANPLTENGVMVRPESLQAGREYDFDVNAPVTASTEFEATIDYALEITAQLTNAPANGMHFVPGEKAEFTLMYYNPTPLEMTSALISGMISAQAELSGGTYIDQQVVASHETLEPDAFNLATYTYTVTQADAERGAAYMVGEFACDSIRPALSNQVMFPCGHGQNYIVGTITYSSAVDVSVASWDVPSQAKAGDLVHVVYAIANTGSTILSLTRNDATHPMVSAQSSAPLSWLPAHETLYYTVAYRLTQADVDAGEFACLFKQNACPYYAIIDGEASDVPFGVPITPVSASHYVNMGKQVSDEAVVTIPLDGSAAPEVSSYLTAIEAELLDAVVAPDAQAGDIVRATIQITNTGHTSLTLNANRTVDGNGSLSDPSSIGRDDNANWLEAGMASVLTVEFPLTQADVDAGVFLRSYTQYASPWYYQIDQLPSNLPADITPRPSNISGYVFKTEEAAQDTVDIRLSLNGEEGDEPAGTEKPAYHSAVEVELNSVSLLGGCQVGDIVRVTYTLTNTGETTLTALSYMAYDRTDTFYSYMNSERTPGSSWLKPGQSYTGTLDYALLPCDVEAGSFYVRHTQYAQPFYVEVNGEKTDIPADIVPMPEDTTGWYSKREERVSGTFEAVLPLTGDEPAEKVEPAYHSAVEVELISVSRLGGCEVGDIVRVQYVLTNTGETTLTANSYRAYDRTDTFYSYMNSECTPGSTWLKPGQSYTDTLDYALLPCDVEAGSFYVRYTQNAHPFYAEVNGEKTDIPADIVPRPEGTTGWYSKREERVSGTFEAVLPLTDDDTTGEETRAYRTAIDAELISLSPMPGSAIGDIVSLEVRLTNIGETSVRLYGHLATAHAGTVVTAADRTTPANAEWLKAGDSGVYTFAFPLMQADVEAGSFQRTLTFEAAPWYNLIGENKTDVPADIAPRPEGATDYYCDYSATVTASVDAVLPLHGGETDAEQQDYLTAIDAELISISADGYGVGSTVTMLYRVTNVGETSVCIFAYGSVDSNGQSVESSYRTAGAAPTYWLKAGDSAVYTMQYKLRQADLDVAVFHRSIEEYAAPWFVTVDGQKTGIPSDIAPRPENATDDYCNFDITVTAALDAILPLTGGTPGTDAEDADAPMLSKTILNTPALGENMPFTVGETIEYEISLNNATTYDLQDVTLYDPLLSGTASAILASTDRVAAGYTFDTRYYHTVTEADAAAGYILNTALLTCTNALTGEALSLQASCYTAIQGEGEPAAPTTPETPDVSELLGDASLLKLVVNAPANGAFFVVNEAIEYQLVFTNHRSHELHDVEITDPLKGGNEDATLLLEPIVAPNGTCSATFSYTVTKEDAVKGWVNNTATAVWYNPEINEQHSAPSNTVTTPVGFTEGSPEMPSLLVTKAVVNTPANGQYFVPGEQVQYLISCANYSGFPLTELTIEDTRLTSPLCTFHNPADYVETTFLYTVTDLDAVAGYVSNYATARGMDEYGYAFYGYSDVVTVPCGFDASPADPSVPGDGPFGVVADLSVIKEVESLPLNGSAYGEGETVSYQITYANSGEITLYDVMVYDALAGLTEIASAEKLEPGESRIARFQYTVTAADVLHGSVTNVALAQYTTDGFCHSFNSNAVTVLTGKDGIPTTPVTPGTTPSDPEAPVVPGTPGVPGVPGTPGTPGSPVIPGVPGTPGSPAIPGVPGTPGSPAIPGVPGTPGSPVTPGTIDLEKLRTGDPYCVRILSDRSNTSVSYKVSYCPTHAAKHVSVMTLSKAAPTPGMQMQIAALSVAQWRAEAERLYQEVYDASDAVARITVMTEYIRFLTDMTNFEALLNALHPGQPVVVAQKLANAWEDKCVTMCYELHAPAEARRDSLLLLPTTFRAVSPVCSCETADESSVLKAVTFSFCPLHSFPFSMTDSILQGQDTAEAWAMVRQIWSVELNGVYSRLMARLGENGHLAMAEYAVLTQWMLSREAVLTALYPDNPELVAQSMVKLLMERVNALCN